MRGLKFPPKRLASDILLLQFFLTRNSFPLCAIDLVADCR